MRQEKMKLKLVISMTMDKWAIKNPEEHSKIRLSQKARSYYNPINWEKILVTIHGKLNESRLNIGQAAKEDINLKNDNAEIGFVTTKTYTHLMGKGEQKEAPSWITESFSPLMLGCDPEFVLVEQGGKACYADEKFNNKWDKLGSDGPCAELRPDPSTETSIVIKNIKNLLYNCSDSIKDLDWVGGASYYHEEMDRTYYIGGHIHLGVPSVPLATDLAIQKGVIRILDEYVALPLIKIDTPNPEARRNGPDKYGSFGDSKHYENKLEWRVPSGLWLVHPELAKYVLDITKATAEEVWKEFERQGFNKTFMVSSSPSDKNLLKVFDCDDSEKTRQLLNTANPNSISINLLKKTHAKIKTFSTYPKYSESIDAFFSLCRSKQTPFTKNKLFLKRGWLNNEPLL
jgi:hypothetical protein